MFELRSTRGSDLVRVEHVQGGAAARRRLPEAQLAAAGQVHEGGGQRVPIDVTVEHDGAAADGSGPAGGAGISTDGSSRYTGSGRSAASSSRPSAMSAMSTSGARTRPVAASTWRASCSWLARSAVVAASILDSAASARRRCRTPQVRQHVVLVDGLPLAVGEVGRGIAGSGVQLHLAVALALLEVEQDGKAVIEALATDAPLVDEGSCIGLSAAGVSLSGLTWV